MISRHFGGLLAAFLALSAAACGGESSGARGPTAGPPLGAPDVRWRHKTHEERQAFMGAHVEPVMRRVFQSYDANGFSDFACETCHGSDMEIVDFHMPNGLYALPKDDPIGGAKEYDEKVANFMMTKVVPTFSKMLQEKPGDPGGVTCFTCHPKE